MKSRKLCNEQRVKYRAFAAHLVPIPVALRPSPKTTNLACSRRWQLTLASFSKLFSLHLTRKKIEASISKISQSYTADLRWLF